MQRGANNSDTVSFVEELCYRFVGFGGQLGHRGVGDRTSLAGREDSDSERQCCWVQQRVLSGEKSRPIQGKVSNGRRQG